MSILRFTAADIAEAQAAHRHGPIESIVLELCAKAKTQTHAHMLLVRLTFPADAGGIEVECRRWSWRSWLCWWLAGRDASVWDW